jgi:hypothetical protein
MTTVPFESLDSHMISEYLTTLEIL